MEPGRSPHFNDEFDRNVDRIRALTEDKDFDPAAFNEAVTKLFLLLFPGQKHSIDPSDADSLITARLIIADYVTARDGK